MPSGDGRGPLGHGALTGRGAGYCAGHGGPGFMRAGLGAGRGFGRCGRGAGFFESARGGFPRRAGYPGAGYFNEYPPESEIEALKRGSVFYRDQIEQLESRISELRDIISGKAHGGE